MPYLYKLRRWGVKNGPHLMQELDNSQKGILRHEKEKEANIQQNPTKFMEKLHSLYFPVQWQEALVSPERLLMMNGMMNTPEEVKYWIDRLQQPATEKEPIDKELVSTLIKIGFNSLNNPSERPLTNFCEL